MRPAGTRFPPTCNTPLRKVPVATTTALARIFRPSAVSTPATTHARTPPGGPNRAGFWSSTPVTSMSCRVRAGEEGPGGPGFESGFSRTMRSYAAASTTSTPGVPKSIVWTLRLYVVLSICARGPRTAGPLDALRTRNWIPDASAAAPMIPPSASISRTNAPLASPPIEGLQDISPTEPSGDGVTRATRAPRRAAAAAASVPAWPPPMTTTSKSVGRCAEADAIPRRATSAVRTMA
mmetsp:Transcript_7700/g.31206  ORF Transcript_7700/g.31206 Transcript_7700/m.31206 type:complete len:236 (-) Transcript_7700:130-837(-)